MLSHREIFNLFIQTSSSVMISEQFSEVINIFCDPCTDKKGANRQKYCRIRKRYVFKELYSSEHLYVSIHSTQKWFKVVSRGSLFDLFERVHTGRKHLGRDSLFSVLKQQYCGFSKELIQVYLNSCSECQLQKCRKQLKSTVNKPIRTSEFASRGQVDLIDLQNTHEIKVL